MREELKFGIGDGYLLLGRGIFFEYCWHVVFAGNMLAWELFGTGLSRQNVACDHGFQIPALRQYYLYNWKCPRIEPKGIGLVLL